MKYHSIHNATTEHISGFDLANIIPKIGDCLIEGISKPSLILTDFEYNTAKQRAELLNTKTSDLIITVIWNTEHGIYTEPVLLSKLEDREHEMKSKINCSIIMAYCEETGEIFIHDDHRKEKFISEKIPIYGKKRKRIRRETFKKW